MKIVNNIFKYCGAGLIMLAAATVTLNSCTENIDDSDLYTFTGEMMIDHFEKDPDTYSSYLTLLGKVHPSKRSASTMKELLSARGNYTCFAPTNKAIEKYLDSLLHMAEPEVSSTDINEIPDSVAETIVFNSIIENGNEAAFAVTDFEEGALAKTNMKDRFIDISYGNDENNNTVIYVNVSSKILESTEENEIENGFIHTIDKVLSPSNASVADLLTTTENTKIFGLLIEKTGWAKKMSVYQDKEWEAKHEDIRGTNYKPAKFDCKYPEHRYTCFTVFVETDSVFTANGITDIESLYEYVKANAYYDDDTSLGKETSWGTDYENENNWLNQFVAYHILPERLTYNKLVTFANEPGYDASTIETRNSNSFTTNVWEYWETIGVHRRSLKVTGIRGEKRINRVSVYNKNNYRERTSEMSMFGIKVNQNNDIYGNNALNGYYYPIDQILIWNKDVPNKVLNERMRYDVTAMFPEFMSNDLRLNFHYNDRDDGGIIFTDDYLENLVDISSTTYFQYLPNRGHGHGPGSWMNYQTDEFNIQGEFDFTMKLPPVPYTGTYEIRYGINANDNRGMAQIYIGKNPRNLPAIGIPIDLRSSSGTNPVATGWVKDGTDADANAETDKTMRNLGFMKGPKYVTLNAGAENGRDNQNCLRKIIYTGQLEAGQTYYIRFKSVLSGSNFEFFYDYLELVPKSVYEGLEAEDVW
ncbi:MAG: fasciclin domain-containing protein [Prevotellaceae bacterium]|nr:fasciclin domain-containing protein [Candidatus Minthosoma caballi]